MGTIAVKENGYEDSMGLGCVLTWKHTFRFPVWERKTRIYFNMSPHAGFSLSSRASLDISPQPFLISEKTAHLIFHASSCHFMELDLLLWLTLCFVYHNTSPASGFKPETSCNCFYDLIMQFYLWSLLSHIWVTWKSRTSPYLASSQPHLPFGSLKSTHHD